MYDGRAPLAAHGDAARLGAAAARLADGGARALPHHLVARLEPRVEVGELVWGPALH